MLRPPPLSKCFRLTVGSFAVVATMTALGIPRASGSPLIDMPVNGGGEMILGSVGTRVLLPMSVDGSIHNWLMEIGGESWDLGNEFLARDLNADGSVVLGQGLPAGFQLWTEATGWEEVEYPAGYYHGLYSFGPRSISDDGNVVYGDIEETFSWPCPNEPNVRTLPFRWTRTGGFEIGLSGSALSAICTGASPDGGTILGIEWGCPPFIPGAYAEGGISIGPLPDTRLVDASRTGRVVVGQCIDPATRLLVGAIIVGPRSGPLTLPGDWSGPAAGAFPFRVNAYGDVLLGRTDAPFVDATSRFCNFVWTENSGIETPAAYLTSIGAEISRSWTDLWIADMDAAGLTLVGRGLYNGFLRNWYFVSDRDEDGIPDRWETPGDGIPMEGGAVYDLAGLGASPLRKDIFVEIDAMTDMAPDNSVLEAVKQVFNTAPVPALAGGLPGVNLHLFLDKTDLPLRPYVLGKLGNADFRADKDQYFGFTNPALPPERSLPSWEQIREAKRKVFRYCIFAYSLPCGLRGLGEQWGDDFRLGLGLESPPGGTSDEKAGVFMHELGHTLGLDHGGGDPINLKPNYYSVMNYMWTIPRDWCPPGAWKLRYSNDSLPELCEGQLDETKSLGGNDPDVWVPYSVPYVPPVDHFCSGWPPPNFSCDAVPPPNAAYERWTRFGSNVDWDGDGLAADPSVSSDVNVLIGKSVSPYQVFVGFDDWKHLKYGFRESGNFGNFVDPTYPDELTGAEEEVLDGLRVGGAECPPIQLQRVGSFFQFICNAGGAPLPTLCVAAAQPGLTYQWFLNGTAIPYATDSTWTGDRVGVYRCVAIDDCDRDTVDFFVNLSFFPPAITRQPESVTVNEGDSAYFWVEVNAPASYVWRKDGQVIAGSEGAFSWGFEPVALSDAGVYDVIVNNGCGAVISEPCTLTVLTPTPVALALVTLEVEPQAVRLAWQGEKAASRAAWVERRTMESDWERLGSAEPEGPDRLTYVDHSVAPGMRYGYRLRVSESEVLEPSWVTVPGRLELALAGALPNPTSGDLVVEFTLPTSGSGALELFDARGRLVDRRDLVAFGPGRQRVLLGKDRLAAGVYLVRLTYGARSLVAKATVLR